MGVKKRFKNRESGIELLRIIAMLLIVLHHEVMHNALPVLDQELSVRKLTLQLFYFTPGKVGIALFFIISAWFVVDKTPSLRLSCRKVWILERELLFWSLCLGAVTLYKVPEERTIESLWKILFPLSRNTWWYADKGLRTFSWRPNGKIFVCSVLRNESVRWSCISPRR